MPLHPLEPACGTGGSRGELRGRGMHGVGHGTQLLLLLLVLFMLGPPLLPLLLLPVGDLLLL